MSMSNELSGPRLKARNETREMVLAVVLTLLLLLSIL
jgi:hypothetical protein